MKILRQQSNFSPEVEFSFSHDSKRTFLQDTVNYVGTTVTLESNFIKRN